MILTSARLLLEPLLVAHADQLPGLLDRRVYAHFASADAINDLSQLRDQFEALLGFSEQVSPERRLLNLVVRVMASGELIGRLEALLRDRNAELAFLFVPEVWGHGYAREAVQRLMDHLVAEARVATYWVSITPTNARSIALCRRLGFEPALQESWPELATYDDGDVVMRRAVER